MIFSGLYDKSTIGSSIVILIVVKVFPPELFAQIVYIVVVILTDGVPEISPFVNVKP